MKNYKVGDRVWLVDEKQFAKIVSDKRLTDYGERYPVFNEEVDLLYKHECQISKTADDMFKELGFKLKETEEYYIYILKKYTQWKIYISKKYGSYYVSLSDTSIAKSDHQAIHQKLIELGWIE